VSKVLHLVEKPVVAYYGYSECCASRVPGSTDVKRGQASIYQNRFNKTFEHTLNYNNDLSDNFNLDALVGYSYYDYTADGSFSSGKGYDSAQTNLIDNIEGGLQNEFRVSSFKIELNYSLILEGLMLLYSIN
jgi:hypothetical protein